MIRSLSYSICSSLRIFVQLLANDFGADILKIEPLAARLDRSEHLVWLSRGEDELDMLGRFFEDLQQRVERAGTEHVNFVDDVDLEACPCRTIDGIFAKLADVIDAGVGGTVDLDDVDIVALIDGYATVTFEAGIDGRAVGFEAVEAFGENAGHGGLADAACAAQQIKREQRGPSGSRFSASAQRHPDRRRRRMFASGSDELLLYKP